VCNLRSGMWLALLAAVGGAAPSFAQEAPRGPGVVAPRVAEQAEPAGYRDAIDGAIREYEAGQFAQARALFEKAHALSPNARTLRGMGMAEFELRNYPSSIYFLEQSLGAPAKPLTPELRTETEQLLGRARSFVGRVIFELVPAGATLALNGTVVPLGPGGALSLIAGDYLALVRADGYSDEQRSLRAAAGETQVFRVELTKPAPPPLAAAAEPIAPAPAAATAAAPVAAPERGESVLASPWLWAAVGVVVAGAAVGLGFALSSSEPGTVKANGGSSGAVLKGPPP
jgi:hypothetical protein